MDDYEPDEGRRMILRVACGLPVAGGVVEVALRLLEAGSVERRAARYGARLAETGRAPEFPAEKAMQAVTPPQQQR